jgi:AraC-like DNA-binding protein
LHWTIPDPLKGVLHCAPKSAGLLIKVSSLSIHHIFPSVNRMSKTIPLISAGALGPVLDWTKANDAKAAKRLAERDLCWVAGHPPERPVPLLPAVGLLVDLSRAHGPDLPRRMAQESGILQIGPLGARALASDTIGGAIYSIAAAMAHHCTHEMVTVQRDGEDLVIHDLWSLSFDDDETVHAVQQYVAAIFASLFQLGAGPQTPSVGLTMRPHPEAGLDHLVPWLGCTVTPSALGGLLLSVPLALANCTLGGRSRVNFATGSIAEWPRLRVDNTLSESVRHLVRSMLGSETPTVDRVADYGGMSRRTLQRRLADEGTSLSSLLDEERRSLATDRAGRADGSLATLSCDLGYAGQASFSRAFRRWNGAAPSRFNRS